MSRHLPVAACLQLRLTPPRRVKGEHGGPQSAARNFLAAPLWLRVAGSHPSKAPQIACLQVAGLKSCAAAVLHRAATMAASIRLIRQALLDPAARTGACALAASPERPDGAFGLCRGGGKASGVGALLSRG